MAAMSTHRDAVSAALRKHAERADAELGVFAAMGAEHVVDVILRIASDLLQKPLQNRDQDAARLNGAWCFSRSTD